MYVLSPTDLNNIEHSFDRFIFFAASPSHIPSQMAREVSTVRSMVNGAFLLQRRADNRLSTALVDLLHKRLATRGEGAERRRSRNHRLGTLGAESGILFQT